jgi:hypothetical protein
LVAQERQQMLDESFGDQDVPDVLLTRDDDDARVG